MYHNNMPYDYCKRVLKNDEVVTIKYRGFNPKHPYNDKVSAGADDIGMDLAMSVHDARLYYDYQDVAKYATHIFDKTPGADITEPRFKMNTLGHLSGPCDGRDREATNDVDIINAKKYLDTELYSAVEGVHDHFVQTAEDLPEF